MTTKYTLSFYFFVVGALAACNSVVAMDPRVDEEVRRLSSDRLEHVDSNTLTPTTVIATPGLSRATPVGVFRPASTPTLLSQTPGSEQPCQQQSFATSERSATMSPGAQWLLDRRNSPFTLKTLQELAHKEQQNHWLWQIRMHPTSVQQAQQEIAQDPELMELYLQTIKVSEEQQKRGQQGN